MIINEQNRVDVEILKLPNISLFIHWIYMKYEKIEFIMSSIYTFVENYFLIFYYRTTTKKERKIGYFCYKVLYNKRRNLPLLSQYFIA